MIQILVGQPEENYFQKVLNKLCECLSSVVGGWVWVGAFFVCLFIF